MVEEHMEAAGGAEQVLLNIIRVRDQAIMVIEVMVGEMGGPRFTKVWMEMRVHINCWPLHLATASHQIRIQTYEFKYVTTPSVTDDRRVVSSSADRADIELEFGTCIKGGSDHFRSKCA